MTTMISELYEALINAGATEEKAREAAVALSAENLNSKDNVAEVKAELAGDIAELDQKLSARITALDEKLSGKITELDQRLSGKIAELDQRLSGKIAELDQRLSGRIAELDKKMAVMQWMVGAALAGIAAILASVVPILVKLFFAA